MLEQLILKETANSRKLAEQAAVERLLNAYLRENNIFDPRISNEQFIVMLKNNGKKISGSFIYWSPIGHHTFGERFYINEESGFIKVTAREVIELIIEELSYFEKDRQLRSKKIETILEHIENSIAKTTMYLEHALMKKQREQPVYLNSEQSLLLGHPFHPTPKSSEGFSESDLAEFAPELGASFLLHYIAISNEYLLEERITESALHFDSALSNQELLEVKQRLGDRHEEYKLLPLHPWQARYLLGLEEVQGLIQRGEIVNLGRLGPFVYPTSSIRTIWDKRQNAFYKLPLHVQITNFIRTNSLEQVKRTMDAAKVIAHIRKSYETDSFRILLELGYRALSIPESSKEVNGRLIQNTAVLFREGVEGLEKKGDDDLYVTASLLEEQPGWKESELAKLLKTYKYNEKEWLRQYLSISLVPMLKLFAETGVSLEAHVQNSLVKFVKGWPETCYVRDLEGISISRNKAEANGWLQKLLAEDSPVLYSEEESWLRFNYYVVVNHLGHLISSLGKVHNSDERELWQVVRSILLEIEKTTFSKALKTYAGKLLESKTLPAKANLVSRFQERGETPLFVEIPNPIYESEGALW
ncbi:siderophore biosynthesis protein SbnE [Bacillus aerolatus]|uniref:Siderophore biosynthesis protein SbnE n=1 Tax=Bacillus aerolatus TaxID=2653354 RepID=A0A6I1FJ27_9BACI|nr:IucA/IucC family protein [Bacillus aerolatus]KAB7706224.1 siderophore biosynthesis protein SbnE [Bacillus aerolatus]